MSDTREFAGQHQLKQLFRYEVQEQKQEDEAFVRQVMAEVECLQKRRRRLDYLLPGMLALFLGLLPLSLLPTLGYIGSLWREEALPALSAGLPALSVVTDSSMFIPLLALLLLSGMMLLENRHRLFS